MLKRLAVFTWICAFALIAGFSVDGVQSGINPHSTNGNIDAKIIYLRKDKSH